MVEASEGERDLLRSHQEILPWKILWPVYLTSISMPVDEAVALPSLLGYVLELGGDEMQYGCVQAVYYLARVVAMPAVGLWVGHASYRRVFATLLAIGVVASIMYAAAPVFGGVGMVIVARALLGVSSSNGVASLTFLAEHIPAERRSGAMAINFGLQRACVPLAPLMNLLVVHLPQQHVSIFPMNKYTYAGLLTAAVNACICLSVLVFFQEPPRACQATTGLHETSRGESLMLRVCRRISRSRAWVSYVLSFQNNWTNQVILWTIPIITSHLYPYLGVVGNSLLLSSGGMTGLVAAFSVPYIFSGVSDRFAILVSQSLLGLALVPFAMSFGCQSSGIPNPPLWLLTVLFCFYNVPFLLQMPANNAIYTKLVGDENRGVYVAILEVSKALARILSGYLIGAAYARLGQCTLWGLTIGIWAFQFIPLWATWKHLVV